MVLKWLAKIGRSQRGVTVGGLFYVAMVISPSAWATFALETAPKETKSLLQLQLQQSQYFGEGQNQVQTGAYSAMGFRFQRQADQWGVDAMSLVTVDGTQQAYVALPELYWQKETARRKLVIGRQRFQWSTFDREWRLGIWQPFVRWDYIHPREQGLVGAFYSLSDENSSLTLFATPFFLPDQGPEFKVVDGEFRSSNRWFRQPVSRIDVWDQERRLSYKLEMPDYREILHQSAFAAQAEFGKTGDGLWGKLSWASKPINQIQVGIDGYLSISPWVNPGESVVVVHPRVARHDLVTLESGWTSDNMRAWVSLTDERTQSLPLPDNWADSTLPSAQYSGAAISHRLPWRGWSGHWVKLAYMKRQITERRMQSGAGAIDSSLSRYPFSDVASFEWSAPVLRTGGRKLDAGVRYLYSLPEDGGLLSATLQYMPQPNLRIDVGLDILGSNQQVNDVNAGLMTLYQNNDRLMGALTYVF